jgi:hypothetical protein
MYAQAFMKICMRSLPRVVSVLVLTLTLICSFAYLAPGNGFRAVAAQSAPPSGSFGFLINASTHTKRPYSLEPVLGLIP